MTTTKTRRAAAPAAEAASPPGRATTDSRAGRFTINSSRRCFGRGI